MGTAFTRSTQQAINYNNQRHYYGKHPSKQPISKMTAPKDIAKRGFAALFHYHDVETVKAVFSEDFIQHNPFVPTGRAPVEHFPGKTKAAGLVANTHRVIADGNLVVFHTTYENAQMFGGQAMVALDVFRVEDGKLKEHWDNLIPVAPANPSGRTQVDGPTTIKDLDKTASNKKVIEDFCQAVLIEHKMDQLTKFISTQTYHQHNPEVADGLDGFGKAVKEWAQRGIHMKYNKIHHVIAEGDFVVTMSEGSFGEGKPTSFYDIFRVEDGLIVEHWDVIADIPPEGKFAHKNGKF